MLKYPRPTREANPVLAREVRTRMRGWRSVLVLIGHIGLLSLVGYGFFYLANRAPGVSVGPQVGPALYTLLAMMELFMVIFITPALTSGAISGERERRTLELILVTPLSSLEIVLGKLWSATGFMLLLVVTAMPLLSTVFLFGGMSPGQFFLTYAVFLMSALTYGSMGILASTVFRNTRAATVAAYGGILIALLGPIAILVMLEAQPGPMKIGGLSLLAAYFNPFVAMVSVLTGEWARNVMIGAPLGTIPAILTRWSPWVYHFALEMILIVMLLALSARLLATEGGRLRIRRREISLPRADAICSEQRE